MDFPIPKKFRICSGSTLKIIAIISMFIDHVAASVIYHGILVPNAPIYVDTDLYTLYLVYRACRDIGRLAFPIFCFLLVEGFFYTSDRKKYALRLLVFSLISEFPFDLALRNQLVTFEYQNVFFTLLIGFLVIWAMDTLSKNYQPVVQLAPVALGCLLAWAMHTDYDYKGIILIVLFHVFRQYRVVQTLAGAVALLWEWKAVFAFIPINLYNGKRGLSMKYFFYIFYPAHLLLLGLILHFAF